MFSKSTMSNGQRIGTGPFRPVSEAHAMSQCLGEHSGLSPRAWLEDTGARSVPWTSHHPSCAFCSALLCQCGFRNWHLCPGLPLNLHLKHQLVHTGTLRSYSKKQKSFSLNSEECSLIFLFKFYFFLRAFGSQPRSSVIFMGGLGAQLL